MIQTNTLVLKVHIHMYTNYGLTVAYPICRNGPKTRWYMAPVNSWVYMVILSPGNIQQHLKALKAVTICWLSLQQRYNKCVHSETIFYMVGCIGLCRYICFAQIGHLVKLRIALHITKSCFQVFLHESRNFLRYSDEGKHFTNNVLVDFITIPLQQHHMYKSIIKVNPTLRLRNLWLAINVGQLLNFNEGLWSFGDTLQLAQYLAIFTTSMHIQPSLHLLCRFLQKSCKFSSVKLHT